MRNEIKIGGFLFIVAVCIALPVQSFSQLLLFNDKAELTGTVSAQTSVYSTNQATNRLDPFTWRITANPRLRIKDLDIPMNLLLGSYEDKLRQSFNKFGLSPKYKDIITIHLGFRNVNFSPLTLAGKTMLGAGFEANYKKVRAGFMWGRLDRAIEIDSLKIGLPTYKRSGFAVKIGYGTQSNYIDLIFLKAKDDPSSLDDIPSNKPIKPAENVVFGISVRQRILKNFHLDFDAALSAYSRDTRAREIEDADLFLARMMKVFIPIRTSNQYMTAWKAKLEYRRQKYAVGVEFDRVEPDFQSMGTYFLRSDIQRFGAYGRFNAMKQKLNGVARFGWQTNDVLHDRSSRNPQVNSSLDLNYLHNLHWNFSLSYSNYNTRQILELNGQEDSTLLKQSVHNISLGATYRKKAERFNHTYNGLLSFQNTSNRAISTSPLVFRTFTFQLRYRMDVPEYKLYVSPAFVFNNYKFSQNSTLRYNPSFIIGKFFLDHKLNAYLNSGFSFIRTGGANQKSIFRNMLNVSYKVFKKHTLSLRMALANNLSNNQGGTSFSEFQGDVIYTIIL